MNTPDLSRLGFYLKGRSTHNARTIMLNELQTLLEFVNIKNANKEDYLHAVIQDNCLGKRSGVNRKKSATHLVDLYSLDPNTVIFNALLYFWQRDVLAQPLLALLCACCRDYIILLLAPYILQMPQGSAISRKLLEEYLESKKPGKFSQATLESTIQNVIASLTKSGHITGRVKKIRSCAKATPGSVSYALFLGYLMGERGQSLFKTGYAKLLDCRIERMIELAEIASRSGWIVFKHIDNIFEVQFPATELSHE